MTKAETQKEEIKINIYNLGKKEDKLSDDLRKNVSNFLFHHLEQYGDAIEDINACISYAEEKGGAIFIAYQQDKLLGASIINFTGMKGFIPENILVYIAVHNEARGKGVGRKLVQAIQDNIVGDIALHVEPDNPARFLYEKCGFTSKYMEMRLIR